VEVGDKVDVSRVEDIESGTQLEGVHHQEDDVDDSELENVDIVNCDSSESLNSKLSSLLPISLKSPRLGTTGQEKRWSTKGGDARRQKDNECQAKPGGLRMNPKTY